MAEKIQNVSLKVVGVTFKNEDGSSRADIIRGMRMGDEIRLIREPENKYDVNAVKVCHIDDDGHDAQIGYIGKEYAAILAPMLDMGKQFEAEVTDCGMYEGRPYCSINVNEL